MPPIDAAAKRLCDLANVVSVEPGPDHLSVVAIAPAPFGSIAKLAADVEKLTVIEATPVSDDEVERWREAHSHAARDLHDREGNPDAMNEGRAKLLAANIGIETPPVMNAIRGDRLGYLFASVADAQAFDRA